MPSSKKDRKNAKDGAVTAAVTKLAAGKFANGSPSKSPPSDSSSPPVNSPDIRPIAQDPSPYDGHPAVSPSLDALSTTSVSAASTTNDWARGAGLAGSPSNLISLMGESPPTQPSSYEDSGRLRHGWAVQRQPLTPQTASPSPPNSMPNHMKRPLSFQMDAQFPLEAYHHPTAAAAYRRSSMQSQLSHARAAPQPPLPHQAQPHFYGAPDIDFDMASTPGMKAGDKGYYFGFDTLPAPHTEFVPGSANVVLAGYEGGLEVYSVTKRGLDRVAGLKGLRGGVYDAKVLPWSTPVGSADNSPLVAVVVHGPVLPQASPEIAIQTANESVGDDRPDAPGSPRTDGSQKGGPSGRFTPAIEFYQTSVELYSLKTGKLVDVLLQAPKVPLPTPVTSPIFKAPPPTGAFTIKADAGNLVVASGTSGECWIYRAIVGSNESTTTSRFGCVGKIWTSVQQPPRGEVAEEAERRHSPAPLRPSPQTPILSLNGKWVAYCPPAASSQIALRAHVPVPLLGKAPGISSVTSPVLPAVTGSVDSPMAESMVNKIMRETTQELISGAKWVGQQGLQAWNSYWNKNTNQTPSSQSRSPPLTSQQWAGSYPPRHDAPQFPPTHGTPGQAVTKDPGLVSILDMDGLPASATLHPLITFASPLGCSFLSFSPTGLSLFTASGKGDVQTVWDLMCIQYTKSSPLQVSAATSAIGPRVRQVAQFSRMTVARIVDVAWSKPNGERIAMVTERGTVHLLDMPSSAFTWPPPRRRKATEENGAPSSDAPSSAVSIASSAFGAAYHAARPLITRPRRSSVNTQGLATGGNFVDSASVGGRAIAASISHSLGKTGVAINQLRHTGENRVSLPQSSALPASSCVVWITGRKYHTLYVVGDGLVRSFPSKTRRSPTASSKQRAPRGLRYKDFKAPVLPDDGLSPAVRQFIDSDEHLDLSDRETDAGKTLTLDPRARPLQVDLSAEASIPQAEIESSAPYQPFHTDRRVSLYEYGGQSAAALPPSLAALMADTTLEDHATPKQKKRQQRSRAQHTPIETDLSQPWAFGQPLNLIKLDTGHHSISEDEFSVSDDHRALPLSSMERVMHRGENGDEIVVTTRRRRGARHMEDEDGFFEDDCEVLDFADQRV